MTAEADKASDGEESDREESDGEEVPLVAVLTPSLTVVALIIILAPVPIVGWRLMKRYAYH